VSMAGSLTPPLYVLIFSLISLSLSLSLLSFLPNLLARLARLLSTSTLTCTINQPRPPHDHQPLPFTTTDPFTTIDTPSRPTAPLHDPLSLSSAKYLPFSFPFHFHSPILSIRPKARVESSRTVYISGERQLAFLPSETRPGSL
jgi:hypothetical protein